MHPAVTTLVVALLVLALLGIFIVMLAIGIGFFIKVPFVPSSRKQTNAMVKATDLSKAKAICDLGAGNGTTLYAAAKVAPKALLHGYEYAPLPLIFHWLAKPF